MVSVSVGRRTGRGMESRRVMLPAPWLALCLAAWVATGAGAQQQMCPGADPQPLTNLSVVAQSLAPNCQQLFVVTSAALEGTPCAYTLGGASTSWLQVELWDAVEVARQRQSGYTTGGPRANPLLMVAKGAQPKATYSDAGVWQYDPAGTLVDTQGSMLLAPYQQVQAGAGSPSLGALPSYWHITVQDVALWMDQPLQYELRVSCQTQYACPSPLLLAGKRPGAPCSGHGTCAAPTAAFLATARSDSNNSSAAAAAPAAVSASSAAAGNGTQAAAREPVPPRVCACQGAFGDAGCDVPLTQLARGAVAARAVPVGGWAYFQLAVPPGVQGLLVEMNRSAGDPVLFVKPAPAGFRPGGLPTVLDYNNFTDSVSFRERLDFHSRLLQDPPAGLTYIAVYNNDVYLQEDARVSLQARWTTNARVAPLCSANCTSNGLCVGLGTCKCFQGYTGAQCEGPVAGLTLQQGVTGAVAPGGWAFWQLDLAEGGGWSKHGLEVRFLASGGHPVLLAQRSGYPTYLRNDFLFRSKEGASGDQLFRVSGRDLQNGTYTIGIFDMNFFVHQAFQYQLQVTQAPGSKFSMTPYFSIIIGVTISILLCVLLSFVKRYLRNRRLRRARGPALQLGPRPARDRGIDAALLDTFPTHEFTKAAAAAREAAPPSSVPLQLALSGLEGAAAEGQLGDGEAWNECTVCLCEYEEGEVLRTLPCHHLFHAKCIDCWLASRSSCPCCRQSVAPPPAPSASTEAASEGQVSRGGRAGSARTSGLPSLLRGASASGSSGSMPGSAASFGSGNAASYGAHPAQGLLPAARPLHPPAGLPPDAAMAHPHSNDADIEQGRAPAPPPLHSSSQRDVGPSSQADDQAVQRRPSGLAAWAVRMGGMRTSWF